MEGLVTVIALAWLALSVWFIVISIRFLRSGRKAFDRYLSITRYQPVADPRGNMPAAGDPTVLGQR